MSRTDHRTLTCPECAATLPADAATRDALLAHGCPVCACAIPGDALRRR